MIKQIQMKNKLRGLLIFLLILNSAKAAENAQHAFENLKNEFKIKTQLYVAPESFLAYGKKLEDFENQFKTDLKNQPALGLELEKYKRLNKVHQQFRKCLKHLNSQSSLGGTILNQMTNNLDRFDLNNANLNPCQSSKIGIDLLRPLSSALKTENQKQLQKTILEQVKVNSFENMMLMKLTLPEKNQSPSQIQESLLNFVCKPQSSCSTELRKKLEVAAQKSQEQFKAQGSPVKTAAQVADEMNNQLKEMNAYAEASIEGGDDKFRKYQAQKKYDQLQIKFWSSFSSGTGLLFHMDSMQSKFGTLSAFNGLKNEGGARARSLTGHLDFKTFKPQIKAADINLAQREYSRTLFNLIHETNQKINQTENNDLSKENIQKNLNSTLIDNPLAVAQVLMNEPDQAESLCESLNQIDEQNLIVQNLKEKSKLATHIVGGVLVGAGMVGSAFFGAGTPVAALGASMMTAGTATFGVAAGINATEYVHAQYANSQLIKGLQKGSIGQISSDYRKNLEISSETGTQAAVDVAFGAIGLGAFSRSRNLVRAASGEKQLNALEKAKPEQLRRIGDQLTKNEIGKDLQGEAIGLFSGLPDGPALLKELESTRINSADLKKIIEEVEKKLATCL